MKSAFHESRLYELPENEARALLIGTYKAGLQKETMEHLDELERLGDTFGLITALKVAAPLREIDAGTFIGSGKVQEIKEKALALSCNVIIFDDELLPQQQRNLEKLIQIAVIDRTELILGVFAQRAHTKEAKLQIELASCRYQMPRLKRLWTHLGRQRSGGASGGFVKGEGEKQIEIDRRILKAKIDRLQKELKEVKKHREIQRKARERSSIPTFAIIGYTNAGKSTLLKALTDADVLVEDKLFATLDTTTRKFILPNNQAVLLIDTVGFIRKIPHSLIAAFRSTLEEALKADILLHLIDVSHTGAAEQSEATFEVLKELGAKDHRMITVLNKVDACESRLMIDRIRFKHRRVVEISALQKKGFERLLDLMMEEISTLRKKVKLRIPQSQYAKVAQILQEGHVLMQDYEENDVLLEVEIPHSLLWQLESFLAEPLES